MKGLSASFPNICSTGGCLTELIQRMLYVPVLHCHLPLSQCYCCNLLLFWTLGPTACVHLRMLKHAFQFVSGYKQDFKCDSPKFVINICTKDSGVKL